MKPWLIAVALCLTLVMGCTPPLTGSVPPNAPPGLAVHTPQQRAEFEPVLNRYFYLRKQAVITGDLTKLWAQYPALREGTNAQTGVNAEADVLARYRALQVIDGDIDSATYERFLVQEDGDRAVLLINGTELYLTREFKRSGGALQLLLYLERQGGAWTIVKTDETTLPEAKQH
ncbi:MAG: hypothetical protein ACM3XM_11630 [Mycobacterium leprae]